MFRPIFHCGSEKLSKKLLPAISRNFDINRKFLLAQVDLELTGDANYCYAIFLNAEEAFAHDMQYRRTTPSVREITYFCKGFVAGTAPRRK